MGKQKYVTTDKGLFSTQHNLASVLDDRNWHLSEPFKGGQEYIPENCELFSRTPPPPHKNPLVSS